MTSSKHVLLPRLNGRRIADGGSCEGKTFITPGKRTDLPGIGSYVIDSPEDENMGARQRCFRYQESHRGVNKPQTNALPEIPKRCNLKPVPVVTLKDMSPMASSPRDPSRGSPSRSRPISGPRTPEDLTVATRKSRRDGQALQQILFREERLNGVKIPPPQEELVSRSPIGRLSQYSPNNQQASISSVTGFGVRKPKIKEKDLRQSQKEYTNLSVNVELSVPDHVTCRATDRELFSQADYRRQLTFLLTPLKSESAQSSEKGSDVRHFVNFNDENRGTRDFAFRDIPRDKIGPSSRHQIWASNLSLRQLILSQRKSTPDLRRKIADAKKGVSMSAEFIGRNNSNRNNDNNNERKMSFNTGNCSNRDFIYGPSVNPFGGLKKRSLNRANDDNESDSDADEDDAWLSMVDTPLVEHDGYDRYANVRLPKSRGMAKT